MHQAKGKKTPKGKIQKPGHRRQPEEAHDLITAFPAGGPEEIPPAFPVRPKDKLGDRIRQAREMRGLTLKDLSTRTGIAVEALERVERNEIIPPLGELIRLGKAVEMKMGYFISPGVDKPMTVVRAESRPAISRFGKERSEQYGYFYESLAPEKANRFMEPFLIGMVPSEVKDLSTHDGQEFIFVLEGQIIAQVEGQSEVLKAGDAIYYDSNKPHLVKCAGDQPAKILAVLYAGAK
jgi:quercetin dioxygenase-like cupin family protein